MAKYPTTSNSNTDREANYANQLLEIPFEELPERISLKEANRIDSAADEGKDILGIGLSDSALDTRFNRAVYDDEVEDFIAASTALGKLITRIRETGLHPDAERVRLLRSARAVLSEISLSESEPNNKAA